MILPERKGYKLFTGEWVKEGWRRMKWKLYARVEDPEKRYLPKGKGWTLYRRMSELLLSPKEGWHRMKWKVYAKVQRPEKWASSWEEGLSSSLEGEWAVAESQRGMMQDKVKLVCQCATPWKIGIFLRGRIEFFTGGWVRWCLVPKRDDAENEKNDNKTDKGNRKGKYKHLVWYNLMYKKDFSFFAKDL